MAEPSPRTEQTEGERRSLPVVVSAQTDQPGNWLTRLTRVLFGWRAPSPRADLEFVLTAEPAQSDFSPEEATMLKNILGLRETRIEGIMVPRADIVAVQQDITLGELVRVFEGAGHSRLVVYNDTLDDPAGMVHIRDLIAFMAARASHDEGAADGSAKAKSAALNFANIDLATPLTAAKIVREILYAPPSMPALDLLTDWFRLKIWWNSLSAILPMNTMSKRAPGSPGKATAHFWLTAAPASTMCAPRSAANSMWGMSRRKSTRSAVTSSLKPAMCQFAANWCPGPSRLRLRFSMPIRAGLSASKFICARIAGRQVRARRRCRCEQ
jgi:CBS domain-containing protein